jgi:hypothetical protein
LLLVPYSRLSPWLPAARKLPLRLLPRLLRLLKLLRLLRLPRLLTLLRPLRPLKLLRLLRLLRQRNNPGNGIVSAKPVQVGSGLPGFSVFPRLDDCQRTYHRQQRPRPPLD